MRTKDETIANVNSVVTGTNVTLSGAVEGRLHLFSDSTLLN